MNPKENTSADDVPQPPTISTAQLCAAELLLLRSMEQIGKIAADLRAAKNYAELGSAEIAAPFASDAASAIDALRERLVLVRVAARGWSVWAQGLAESSGSVTR